MLKKSLALISAAVSVLVFNPAAGAAPAGPLAQVIEGAKKEGVVLVKLVPGFTQKSIYRLEKEIKDKYGVQLSIKFTGSTNFPNDVAEAIMEQKVGAIPAYDLLTLSSTIAEANKANILENVDWNALLSEGTNPEVVHDNPLMRGGIVYKTAHLGLMYNPEKVKANEAPRTLGELANPKWKGKVGIQNYANAWQRQSFLMGKEKVVSALRAILKNGAIQGTYIDQVNRYLLGEIWISLISSEFTVNTREKGMPTAWQTMDFGDVREYSAVVRKGASHANGAKLIALYLAGPEGAKFNYEEAKGGTLYYPGNYEHDIRVQNQKQGIKEIFSDRRTDLLEFYTSSEAKQLQKEISLVLQTGGER